MTRPTCSGSIRTSSPLAEAFDGNDEAGLPEKAHDISEQNKTITRRWIEEIAGKGELDLAGEFNCTSPLASHSGAGARRRSLSRKGYFHETSFRPI
jgi:hypothetical protein